MPARCTGNALQHAVCSPGEETQAGSSAGASRAESAASTPGLQVRGPHSAKATRGTLGNDRYAMADRKER